MWVWAKVIFWLCKLGLVLAVSFWVSFSSLTPGWSCPSKEWLGLTVTAECSWMGFQEAITHKPCLSGCTVLNSVSLKIFKWTPAQCQHQQLSRLHFTHKESQAWSCRTLTVVISESVVKLGPGPSPLYRRRRPSRMAAGMQLSPVLQRRPCSSCLRGSCPCSPWSSVDRS